MIFTWLCLVEELQELWKGVDAWDVTHPEGSRRFTLHAILIWSIHDLPTYGLLSKQMTKGYKGCLACGLTHMFSPFKSAKEDGLLPPL